jgi:hypothetical protein
MVKFYQGFERISLDSLHRINERMYREGSNPFYLYITLILYQKFKREMNCSMYYYMRSAEFNIDIIYTRLQDIGDGYILSLSLNFILCFKHLMRTVKVEKCNNLTIFLQRVGKSCF